MLFISFLVKSFLDFYIAILIFRIWIYFTHCNTNNSIINYVIKITQPFLNYLYKFIPNLGPLDNVSLLVAYLLSILELFVINVLEYNSFSFNFIFFVFGIFNLLKITTKIFFWMLIIRAISVWINYNSLYYNDIIYQLSEPIIYPIRCLLILFTNKDISLMISILLFHLLNLFFNNIFILLHFDN